MVLKYYLVGSFKHCTRIPKSEGERQSLGLAAVCISLPWATREPLHIISQSSSRAWDCAHGKKGNLTFSQAEDALF